MGQKVKPISLRLGINRTWDSRWYAEKNYGELLIEDYKIREYIKHVLFPQAGVSRVIIERPNKRASITIHSSRPGVLIGKKGSDIDILKKTITKVTKSEVQLNIVEVLKHELDAKLVASTVAQQIERRINYRRAIKRAIQTTMRLGASGIKIMVSGRLSGAEIARVEHHREGSVPLHTIRSDIDYGFSIAKTSYGTCGVKVWITLPGSIQIQSSDSS